MKQVFSVVVLAVMVLVGEPLAHHDPRVWVLVKHASGGAISLGKSYETQKKANKAALKVKTPGDLNTWVVVMPSELVDDSGKGWAFGETLALDPASAVTLPESPRPAGEYVSPDLKLSATTAETKVEVTIPNKAEYEDPQQLTVFEEWIDYNDGIGFRLVGTNFFPGQHVVDEDGVVNPPLRQIISGIPPNAAIRIKVRTIKPMSLGVVGTQRAIP